MLPGGKENFRINAKNIPLSYSLTLRQYENES